MHHVGLTGNVAAGKSTVTAMFREWGATVIDADRIVHELQRPGQAVLAAMVERFGAAILRPDGTLDRERLRRDVMADPTKRAALNGIVHPAVQARRTELVASAEARGGRIVVHDIPLLFEVLDPSTFDTIVLVDAPPAVRQQRLEERGLSSDAAGELMASQADPAGKRARSDFVIENSGTLDELRHRARAVWDAILERVRGPSGRAPVLDTS